MNVPLFRYGLRRALPVWIVSAALACAYAFAVVRLYGGAEDGLSGLLGALPPAAGLDEGTLTAFAANRMYLPLLVLPLAYTLALCARLMSLPISRGTMSWLLASPVSRRRIAATQRNVLIVSLFALVAACCAATAALCEYDAPGELGVARFALLCAGMFALQLMLAGVCFLFACWCGGAGRALALSAVVCVLFYLLRLLADLGGPMGYARYVTPFSLVDPAGILRGDTRACALPLVLVIIAAALFALAGRAFRSRNLTF